MYVCISIIYVTLNNQPIMTITGKMCPTKECALLLTSRYEYSVPFTIGQIVHMYIW